MSNSTIEAVVTSAVEGLDRTQLLALDLCAKLGTPPRDWMRENPDVMALFSEGDCMHQVTKEAVGRVVAQRLTGAQ